MKEEQLKTLTDIEALKPVYLGPCDTFTVPPRAGCQSLTVIEATPAEVMVGAMRRESGATHKLYKRYYAVWVN